MRVLILGAEAASHHMLHVRLIAEEILRRGGRLALATTDRSLDMPAGQALMADLGSRISTFKMPPVGEQRPGHLPLVEIADQATQLAAFQGAVEEARREFEPDNVYVVDLDSVGRAIAQTPDPFSGIPWTGMLIRLTFHHTAVGVLDPRRAPEWEEPLLRALLRRDDMRSLLTIDETLPDYAREAGADPAGRLHWVPDTCDLAEIPPRPAARDRLGIHTTVQFSSSTVN